MLYRYGTPFDSIPCDSSSIAVTNQVVHFKTRLMFVVAHMHKYNTMSHFGIFYSLHSFTVVKVSCSLTYCLYHVLSSYYSNREISLFLSILLGIQIHFHTRTTVRFANLTVSDVIWPSHKSFNRKPFICGVPC